MTERKDCLMILQASEIPEVIESINAIDMDKVWFRGFDEYQLMTVLNEFIETSHYDYYWITCNDYILHEGAVNTLLELSHDYDVVTGYARLAQGAAEVNVSDRLCNMGSDKYGLDRYNFLTKDEVDNLSNPIFKSYFAGFTFTGMIRRIWLEYPFECNESGYVSDLQFAIKYCNRDGNAIYSHRDAFMTHLKSHTGYTLEDYRKQSNWLVGNIMPEIIYDGDLWVEPMHRLFYNAYQIPESEKTHILMIMQPRDIPEAINSLKSISVDKVWFRAFSEKELCKVLNNFINETDYDYYWIIADDGVVPKGCFELLKSMTDNYECVTGYSELCQGDDRVNLTSKPLDSPCPNELEDFNFITFEEVESMKSDVFETYHAGWALTGLPREVWLKYPLKVGGKWEGQTDAAFSYRFITEDGNKVYTHKKAYMKHLKNPVIPLKKNWLVGVVEPTIIHEVRYHRDYTGWMNTLTVNRNND